MPPIQRSGPPLVPLARLPSSVLPTNFADVRLGKNDGVVWITIDRPDLRNAFHARTVDERIAAVTDAAADDEIGVVVLTGAGDRAVGSGGDQKERKSDGGDGQGPGTGLNVTALHGAIRACPKPVLAMVNGYAIGGGHVLHLLCYLSIAADTARFGQVGPPRAFGLAERPSLTNSDFTYRSEFAPPPPR